MSFNLTELYKPSSKGVASLETFTITADDVVAQQENIPPGKYIRLLINGKTIMSDTPMEYESNLPYANEAFGDVLVGGLGLGLVLLAMNKNPQIKSIVVVEKERDVIDIIKPQLPLSKKVSIVNGDIHTFEINKKFDYIFLDIWYSSSLEDCVEFMIPLMSRYKEFLKPKSISPKSKVTCWVPKEIDDILQMFIRDGLI